MHTINKLVLEEMFLINNSAERNTYHIVARLLIHHPDDNWLCLFVLLLSSDLSASRHSH